MRRLLLFLAGMLYCSTLFAQQPVYGVWEDQAANNYQFVSLDMISGVKTNIAVIANMTALVSPNNYCMVQCDSTCLVRGMVGADPTLFHIDVATGIVRNQNIVSDILTGFEYNCADSQVYANYVNPSNINYLVTLDPATAAFNILFISTNMNAHAGSTFSLNPLNSTYSFIGLSGSNMSAVTVNYSTQSTSIEAFDDNRVGHVYSHNTGQRCALWENQQNATYDFVDFTPSPATFTPVGTPAGIAPGYISDAYSHDDCNGLYNFIGFNGNNNHWVSLDMLTGQIISSNVATDNVFAWEQLYSICGPPPPPAASIISSELENGAQPETLAIYHINRQLAQEAVVDQNEVTLHSVNLPAGTYR
jgi:hypothetical protein